MIKHEQVSTHEHAPGASDVIVSCPACREAGDTQELVVLATPDYRVVVTCNAHKTAIRLFGAQCDGMGWNDGAVVCAGCGGDDFVDEKVN